MYKEINENKVYIENGEVKMDIFSETMELEEARSLLHEMIEKEYSAGTTTPPGHMQKV